MNTIHSNITVSIIELKKNFADIIKQTDDCPVAILKHNRPEAYLLPAAHYERLVAYLNFKVMQQGANGSFVETSADNL